MSFFELEPEIDKSYRANKDERIYSLLLYKDDIHSTDEMIAQVMKSICCSFEVSEYIVNLVLRDGYATVTMGPLSFIKRAAAILSEKSFIIKITRAL